MVRHLISCLLVALLLAAPGSSRAGHHGMNCDGTQLEINYCAAAKFRHADRELQAVHAYLLGQLDTQDAKERLEFAWRARLASRDSACLREAGPREDYGTYWPLRHFRCMERLTRERVRDLVDIAPLKPGADQVDVVTVTGRYGIRFRHFGFELTRGNLLLPASIRGREALDETAENFRYGQFEVFVPVRALSLGTGCKGLFIVRMPQTLDLAKTEEIAAKQDLFTRIREVAEGGREKLAVVIELGDSPCNLFFRADSGGAYVDYTGPLRHRASPGTKAQAVH